MGGGVLGGVKTDLVVFGGRYWGPLVLGSCHVMLGLYIAGRPQRALAWAFRGPCRSCHELFAANISAPRLLVPSTRHWSCALTKRVRKKSDVSVPDLQLLYLDREPSALGKLDKLEEMNS